MRGWRTKQCVGAPPSALHDVPCKAEQEQRLSRVVLQGRVSAPMASAAGEPGAAQAAEDLTRRLQTQLVRVAHSTALSRCLSVAAVRVLVA